MEGSVVPCVTVQPSLAPEVKRGKCPLWVDVVDKFDDWRGSPLNWAVVGRLLVAPIGGATYS
jgi:hypothetical protein